MEWIKILTLILGNAGFIIPLFIWNRSKSRSDIKHLESSVNAQLSGIREEMKDFHEKLIRLEEKYLKERM